MNKANVLEELFTYDETIMAYYMRMSVVHLVAKFGVINPILITTNEKSELERFKTSSI